MRARISVWACVFVASSIGAILLAQSAAQPSLAPVAFEKDIQPILEQRCLSCHGDAQQLGKFDLRSRESALKGGARGGDLVPGDAEGSRMYRRIAALERPVMPAQGGPLTAEQIDAIRRWINDGAVWNAALTLATSTTSSGASRAALESRTITPEERNYWAFKQPAQAPLPEVADKTLASPIDRFLE